MIYFVEEDTAQNKVFFLELESRGFELCVINNADDAFVQLSSVDNGSVDIVILDVMLAVDSVGKSRFDRKSTGDYIETGLVLLEDLIGCNPSVFPHKAIFYTNASSDKLVKKIDAKVKQHGITLLRKAEFDSAFKFADKISDLIGSLIKT